MIELLLAIGISAIVLVAVNGVLFSALRLRNATTDAVDAAAPIDGAVGILRRDLQNIVTPKVSGVLSGGFKIGSVSSSGSGEPVAVEMSTSTGALGVDQPWGDIQRVSYSLRSGTGNSRNLYRNVTRNLLTYGTPEVEQQLLLGGVDALQIACYDGSQWTERWDTTDTASLSTNLPVAVRVRIELAGRQSAVLPVELFVPIDSRSRSNSTSTVAN
jgi:type II secretion system protein J